MSDFDPSDLLIGDDGDSGGVVRKFRSLLGIERERFVCDDCDVACAATTTYNAATAAFDGGACPAWECPECGREWVRESDTEAHAVDLYGRE